MAAETWWLLTAVIAALGLMRLRLDAAWDHPAPSRRHRRTDTR